MDRPQMLLWGVVLAALGFVFGLFVPHFAELKLNSELSIGDCLSFFTTIAVGIIIGNYVQKRYSAQRIEKDLLIDETKEIIGLLKDLRAIYWECYEEQQIPKEKKSKILALFRTVANSLDSIEQSLKECTETVGDVKIDASKQEYLEFKKILTGGNFPSAPYSMATINQAERVGMAFRQVLQRLIFSINRT